MIFNNRWRIQCVLTTETACHIGSGGTTTRPNLINESEEGRKVDINAVATDVQGRAYIPGTTLKGNIRSWLVANPSIPRELIHAVFGHDDPKDEDATGGKAEFWDAPATVLPDSPPQVPHWDVKRRIGVAVSVALDRQRRTAVEEKLFHEEFVPPGIGFEVNIVGQDLEPEEIKLLLFALSGFESKQNPICLGADTGDGQGQFAWELRDIACLEKKEDILSWLQKPAAPVGYVDLPLLSEEERKALVDQARTTFPLATPCSLTLHLAIQFDSPFLVNDPSRTKPKGQKSDKNDKRPNHAPLRNAGGRPVLPARSLRGALRSQAEKIIRTLNPKNADVVVCSVVDEKQACKAIEKAEQAPKRLCLACQVFGAPGWRTPLSFSDFPVTGEYDEKRQQFLAIDRFTGGGARSLIFNADAVYSPLLTGEMTLDLNRLEPWALGLLAVTLRDLIEGDIPLGFGAAKGYGACTAQVTQLELVGEEHLPEALRSGLSPNATAVLDLAHFPNAEQPPTIQAYVDAFHTQVRTFKKTNSEGDAA